MHKLCRVNIEKSEEIYGKIGSYVHQLIDKINPKLIILFGSFAKKDFNEGSDIDIVVVANFKEKFLDRIKTLMELNTFKIPIEPIGYTPEEFYKMKERGNAFILEVIQNGKILFEK